MWTRKSGWVLKVEVTVNDRHPGLRPFSKVERDRVKWIDIFPYHYGCCGVPTIFLHTFTTHTRTVYSLELFTSIY